MADPLDDSRIIRGCIERDKRSWDLFVERFSRLIYWRIRKTLSASSIERQDELCEEIFQEIFTRLLEKGLLEHLRETTHVRPFLCALACHATLDRLKKDGRRAARYSAIPDETEDADRVIWEAGGSASSEAITQEKKELVAGLIRELTERERFCVEMYYFEGHSHVYIAEILGIPSDTVSTVIRRARERLREAFRSRGIEEI